jgi:arylsulfatase A-like enzyme
MVGQIASAHLTCLVASCCSDQGWGDVSYNPHAYRAEGQPRWVSNLPRTPHLAAMAAANSSIVFWRWYAGSAVCSPSRSAAMTGRTNNRECISGPEPHGYGPSWKCFAPLPLSPLTFTVAEAAKSAGYRTFHSGKWHLGECAMQVLCVRSLLA